EELTQRRKAAKEDKDAILFVFLCGFAPLREMIFRLFPAIPPITRTGSRLASRFVRHHRPVRTPVPKSAPGGPNRAGPYTDQSPIPSRVTSGRSFPFMSRRTVRRIAGLLARTCVLAAGPRA